jgi:photosystem II stability/assembly factor-like uncharacterized protein
VYGSSADDVWVAATGGTLLHTTNAGSTWTKVTVPVASNVNLYDVWSSGPGDVYAVGSRGTVLHGSGSSFTAVTVSTTQLLQSVWGASASDVFLFGGSGTIMHGSAASGFTKQTSGTTDNLYFGWGSRGDVWINGVNSSNLATIYHTSNDGTTWSAQLNAGATLWALWSTTAGDVIAVGDAMIESTDQGAQWTSLPLPPALLYGVGGDPTGVDGVWAVGASGTILHRP